MKISIDHRFRGINREAYERLFFDDAFNDAMNHVAGFKAREVLERRDHGGRRFQKLKIVPDHVPALVQKLAQGEFWYIDETWFDPERHVAEWTSQPSLMTEKLRLSGQIRFLETPDGCRRILDVDVTVNMFAVGVFVEKKIAESLIESYEKIADFTQDWVSSHPNYPAPARTE